MAYPTGARVVPFGRSGPGLSHSGARTWVADLGCRFGLQDGCIRAFRRSRGGREEHKIPANQRWTAAGSNLSLRRANADTIVLVAARKRRRVPSGAYSAWQGCQQVAAGVVRWRCVRLPGVGRGSRTRSERRPRLTAHPRHAAALERASQGRAGTPRSCQRGHHPRHLLACFTAHAGGRGGEDRRENESGNDGVMNDRIDMRIWTADGPQPAV